MEEGPEGTGLESDTPTGTVHIVFSLLANVSLRHDATLFSFYFLSCSGLAMLAVLGGQTFTYICCTYSVFTQGVQPSVPPMLPRGAPRVTAYLSILL